jgi:hypothetical protein
MCFALRVLRMHIGCPADLSDRQPSFFLLLGQKKETKEKAAPHTALILCFSHLARVFRTGFPALRKTRGIPAAPLRADLAKCCDARGGMRGFKTCLRQ